MGWRDAKPPAAIPPKRAPPDPRDRKECAQMKRLAVIAAISMTLFVAVPVATAKSEMVVETIPMTSAPLNSDTCQFLPDGTAITWSGTGTSITRTATDEGGVTTIRNVTH